MPVETQIMRVTEVEPVRLAGRGAASAGGHNDFARVDFQSDPRPHPAGCRLLPSEVHLAEPVIGMGVVVFRRGPAPR